MRYAIVSDVHGRVARLEAVLADARARGVEQVVSLGDVGGDECVSLLRGFEPGGAPALAVFGNYEVSGWQKLSAENRAWVLTWPPLLSGETFVAVHGAPWWPEGLSTLPEFTAWQEAHGSWRKLFPYLNENEDHRWQALAELESAGKAVLLHGHTHVQAAWHCTPEGRLTAVRARAFEVKPGHRYLVGAGSVGVPEGGGGSEYVVYDEEAGRIELHRL